MSDYIMDKYGNITGKYGDGYIMDKYGNTTGKYGDGYIIDQSKIGDI